MFFIKNKSILFLLLLLSVLIIFPAALSSKDIIAYIGDVKGDVKVTRSNPGEIESAKIGMFIFPGDHVKTGKESYAAIIFQDDGSRLKLDSNTSLTLDATRQKKKLNKKMYLGVGKMWAKVVKKRGTDFQVRTPTSVASVKGTKFIIEELAIGQTWLWVLEEAVQLSNETGTWTINEGQYAKATTTTIETGSIEGGCPIIDPGEHKMIFYFEDESGQTRELIIDLEK